MKFIIFTVINVLLFVSAEVNIPVECIILQAESFNTSFIYVNPGYVYFEEPVNREDHLGLTYTIFGPDDKSFEGGNTELCYNDASKRQGSVVVLLWKIFSVKESKCPISEQSHNIPKKIAGTLVMDDKRPFDKIGIGISVQKLSDLWMHISLECTQ